MSITKTHEVFSLPNVPYALFCLYGIAWKNMVEMGRGGAYVPACVALQGRIHRSSPAHDAYVFGMETPLRGRSGGHTGTAPTHFA